MLAGLFEALALMLATCFVAAVAYAYTDAGAAAALRATLIAAGATIAWLLGTALAAANGNLTFSGPFPTMIVAGIASAAIAIGTALSPAGARIAERVPLVLLVEIQAFRLPLEVMMHRAYELGLMPVQMSYSGRNFDIVSGVTALIVVAILWFRKPGPRATRWIVGTWSVLGMALLANIVIVAVLSAPTPLRQFHNEPANVWVTGYPWVWLPTVMVLTAIMGHILVIRRLRSLPIT